VPDEPVIARCPCGGVVVALSGDPIASVACFCDTCEEGAKRIEALPGAASVRDPHGGTEYVVYRKDRVAYVRGADRVEAFRLERSPKTNRVVATCCNAALMMRFDDARHWVPIYRARIGPDAPAVQMRICTSFRQKNGALPDDVPNYPDYPGALMTKLLSSRLAMLFGR
jgi:hypothetical protein